MGGVVVFSGRRGWWRTVASPGAGRSGRAPAGRRAAPHRASGGTGAHHRRDDRRRVQVADEAVQTPHMIDLEVVLLDPSEPGIRQTRLMRLARLARVRRRWPAADAGPPADHLDRDGLPRLVVRPDTAGVGDRDSAVGGQPLQRPQRDQVPVQAVERVADGDQLKRPAPRNASDRSLTPGTLPRHARRPPRATTSRCHLWGATGLSPPPPTGSAPTPRRTSTSHVADREDQGVRPAAIARSKRSMPSGATVGPARPAAARCRGRPPGPPRRRCVRPTVAGCGPAAPVWRRRRPGRRSSSGESRCCC